MKEKDNEENLLRKNLTNYENSKEKILKYFEFKESWKIFPIVDLTDKYWKLEEDKFVLFSDIELNDSILKAEDYTNYEIWKYKHLDKWIYEKELYTMIIVFTGIDDNKLLVIFDNSKKYDENVL